MKKPVIFVSTLLMAAHAYCWNASGHEVIVQIALDTCKPSTAAKVKGLLSSALWGSRDYRNPVIAARFADDIVDPIWGRSPFTNDPENYKEWHYYDKELDGKPSHDEGPGDAIQAINQAKLRIWGLSRATAYPAGKMEALIFLLHFVGDIHQPLHCTDNHDRGGHYDIFIPKAIACHKWWDEEVAKVYKLKAAGATQTGEPLSKALSSIKSCADELRSHYGSKLTPAEIGNLNPSLWSLESYKYGRDFIYPVGNHPTEAQLDAWKEAAFRKMTLAGFRLGRLLDSLATNM